MSAILKALEDTGKYWNRFGWNNPVLARFVETGDEKVLKGVKVEDMWLIPIHAALPLPAELDEHGARLFRMGVILGAHRFLKDWLHRFAGHDPELWRHHPAAVQRLRDAGLTDAQIRLLDEYAAAWDADRNQPNLAGEYYLELEEAEIPDLIANNCLGDTAFLIARHFPDQLLTLLKKGLPLRHVAGAYECFLRANVEVFHEQAYKVFQELKDPHERLSLADALFTYKPDLYRETGWDDARRELTSGEGPMACKLLLKTHAPDVYEHVRVWLASPYRGSGGNFMREPVLDELEANHPTELLEACKASSRSPDGSVALMGLRRWKLLGVAPQDKEFAGSVRELLKSADNATVVKAISEAASSADPALQEDLWALLQHKSRPARQAAARSLAASGNDATRERAAQLLTHKKGDVRLAAITLLEHLGTSEALALMKARLDVEEDDDVRDTILLALERAGGGAGFSPEELQARIVKTLSKFKEPPVPWLKPSALPLVKQDGTKLTHDEIRYLLYRQSRCKEMRADLEAKPLYADLDRSQNGETAAKALSAFLGSGQNAEHRWVFGWAALVGDDRIIAPLFKAIQDWADSGRGKLAEYGAQALALLGTDHALMMVESLSVRYRVKNKNIGKAASDAFAEAAEARGVSVEELGDLVVPWLGFEAGKPRLVETGKTTVEVSIDQDFKLSFRDTKTGKRSGKLPTGTPATVQAEFKEMANTLKEAAKAQVLRIETLLVRQFRWPVSRWQELYLRNPLLRPFTQRLVWSRQGEAGEPTLVFRALEDGTLTDVNEDSVILPATGSVTIAHPLDLEETTRTAWLQHLADYDIAPPFPQLDRPVIRVKDEEKGMRFGKHVHGTELNAMTFRGRAEKIGWVRGSVVDGGGVTSYRKTFAAAGAEAFLNLDGMFIGIGMDDAITLGEVYFVRTGMVKTGSYTYDEPSKEDDPRLVPFGEVPPVPFSEVMGDLRKISGKTGEEIDNEHPPA
jgi:hypothetical protein